MRGPAHKDEQLHVVGFQNGFIATDLSQEELRECYVGELLFSFSQKQNQTLFSFIQL